MNDLNNVDTTNKNILGDDGNNHYELNLPVYLTASLTNTHFNIDNKSCSNLLDMYPKLEPFWDYTKNKQSPKEYSSLHDELIYALCPNKKHDGFQVTITAIIKNKYRCLACEDKILVPGFNSLADRHPEWLQEWDYISNNALKIYPERILTNYSKEVWWVCKNCGCKFKMAPNKYRDFDLRGKTKCLYCKGKRRKRKYFG